jgi:hypothetical protein
MRGTATTGMHLPGDWTDLDLDPTTCHASISRAVREAIWRNPSLAGHRTRLIALLDGLVRRATDAGAFFCSSLVLPVDDGGEPITANLLMQRVDDDHALHDNREAHEVCAGLAAAASCDPDWEEDAETDVVELPSAGPAVRICVAVGGVCVQYVVPVPQCATLVVTFTSPSARYGAALVDLFDAMARTLRVDHRADHRADRCE